MHVTEAYEALVSDAAATVSDTARRYKALVSHSARGLRAPKPIGRLHISAPQWATDAFKTFHASQSSHLGSLCRGLGNDVDCFYGCQTEVGLPRAAEMGRRKQVKVGDGMRTYRKSRGLCLICNKNGLCNASNSDYPAIKAYAAEFGEIDVTGNLRVGSSSFHKPAVERQMPAAAVYLLEKDGARIKYDLTKPRFAGQALARYERYCGATTIREFYDSGGLLGDLQNDFVSDRVALIDDAGAVLDWREDPRVITAVGDCESARDEVRKDPEPAIAKPFAGFSVDVKLECQKPCPRRVHSTAAQRYEGYMHATTVGEYKAAGGSAEDLRHDIRKGFVKVFLAAGVAAPARAAVVEDRAAAAPDVAPALEDAAADPELARALELSTESHAAETSRSAKEAEDLELALRLSCEDAAVPKKRKCVFED